MYENCGFLGIFKTHASEEKIKDVAVKLGICGNGTIWNSATQNCVGINKNYDIFEIQQRKGICECDNKTTYARTQIECENSENNCKWKKWNQVNEVTFDIDR